MRIETAVIVIPLLISAPLYASEKLPPEVQQFIKKREACEHFRGEVPDPEEHERMKEVERQLHKFCRGTDRKLAFLRKKYSQNPAVVRQLEKYESHIEADSSIAEDRRP